MAKAIRLRASAVPCVRTPAAPGAAKTRRFLIHWRGRAARTSPAGSPIAGAAAAMCGSGTGSGRGLGSPSLIPELLWFELVFLPLPTFPVPFVQGLSRHTKELTGEGRNANVPARADVASRLRHIIHFDSESGLNVPALVENRTYL